MKKMFWTLLAVVALTATWNGVRAILAPAWDDECGKPPARFIDYEGNPFRDGFVPIRPTSPLSDSTLQYRLVSRDGSPVFVTFGRRYFEDLEGAAWGSYAAGPEEVAREKGAT